MIAAALLACAANIAPATLAAVIQVESAGSPIALRVNHLEGAQPQPRNAREAALIAHRFMAAGYKVDIGLMQISDRNLSALGLSVEQALDPCANIHGGGQILTENYGRAVQAFGEGQAALRAALSAYNTGDFHAGVRNGYVARYYRSDRVPALAQGGSVLASVQADITLSRAPDPFTAATEVAFTEQSHAQLGN